MRPDAVVLLWDLDGTLLTTGRAGVYALEEALAEVCGVKRSLQELATSGLTDAEVAELVLRTAGVSPEEEIVLAFLRAYERRLPAALPRRQGRVLEGVEAILADLHGRDDVLSLLATGNTRAGAAAKLRHYGLGAHFDGDGAFCVGPGPRESIVRAAVERAADRLGTEPVGDRLYLIGDTPHDLRCGRAVSARTIAVASGSHSASELAAHEPWIVLERLPEPGTFRKLVGLPA